MLIYFFNIYCQKITFDSFNIIFLIIRLSKVLLSSVYCYIKYLKKIDRHMEFSIIACKCKSY